MKPFFLNNTVVNSCSKNSNFGSVLNLPIICRIIAVNNKIIIIKKSEVEVLLT